MTKLNPKLTIPSNLQISSQSSSALDYIRAFAAFLVMIGHLRALFFVPYSEVKHSNIFIKFAYFMTGFGHQAVIVFFVLSGFFISSSIFRMYQRNRWSWKDYLAQRLVRLWIVLIPALVLTYLWDSSGIYFFGKSVYLGLPYDEAIMNYSVIARLNLQTFLGNVFFLQGIITSTFGSNGPLWSLSYEFWYYIAFPCALTLLLSPSKKVKVANALILLGLGIFVGQAIALSFGIWMLGVAVIFLPFLWHNHKPVKSYVAWLATVPLLVALVLSVSSKQHDFSWATAVTFALLMYLIFRVTNEVRDKDKLSLSMKSSKYAAGFSYSLYLLHLPPLVFLHSYVHSLSSFKWQPTAQNSMIAILIIFWIIFYCWLISLLTEARTTALRGFIKRNYNV